MRETDEYRYSLHVYDGLKVSPATFLDSTWRPPGSSEGCTGTPTPCLPAGCAISPWAYSCGSGDILFMFGRTINPIPSGTFRRSTGYSLTVVSDMYGPILSMVRRSPSVFNNLLSGLYAKVCGMGCIPMNTNQMSLNTVSYTHLTLPTIYSV